MLNWKLKYLIRKKDMAVNKDKKILKIITANKPKYIPPTFAVSKEMAIQYKIDIWKLNPNTKPFLKASFLKKVFSNIISEKSNDIIVKKYKL